MTPKGTVNPTRKSAPRPDTALQPEQHQPLPRQVLREKGRASRPETHNRGNR